MSDLDILFELDAPQMRYILAYLSGADTARFREAVADMFSTWAHTSRILAETENPEPEYAPLEQGEIDMLAAPADVLTCDGCLREEPEDVMRVCAYCDANQCTVCRDAYGQCCEQWLDNYDERI